MDDVINTATNTLWEIKYQKLHHSLDLHRLQYTNYQIAIAYSTSITVGKKNYFTVICVYLIASTFLHKAIVHKPAFVPLSNNGEQYACVCTLMVIK